MKLKWKRINSTFIEYEDYLIIKDYGSRGSSKPFYCVEYKGETLMHGFTRQRDAKQWVNTREFLVKTSSN